MSTAARPLRALAGVLALYAGGRVAVRSYIQPAIAKVDLPAGATNVPGPIAIAASGSGQVAVNVPAVVIEQPASMVPVLDRIVTQTMQVAHVLSRSIAPAGRRSIGRTGEVLAVQKIPSATPFAGTSGGSIAHAAGPAESSTLLSPAAQASAAAPGLPVARANRAGHISGSIFAIAREGSGGRDLAGVATLGGSQAGARVNLDTGFHGTFATVRASGALARRDNEVAVGLGIRGHGVGVIVENRFAIDGRRRSEAALLGYGGFDAIRLPAGFKLDGYAQAGVVGVSRRALFVDAATRADHLVVAQGRSSLSAGGGVWGAAQPGVSRLDIGPQLVARLPIDKLNTRIGAEYRFRIAGRASPANGLTVSLGADF